MNRTPTVTRFHGVLIVAALGWSVAGWHQGDDGWTWVPMLVWACIGIGIWIGEDA